MKKNIISNYSKCVEIILHMRTNTIITELRDDSVYHSDAHTSCPSHIELCIHTSAYMYVNDSKMMIFL